MVIKRKYFIVVAILSYSCSILLAQQPLEKKDVNKFTTHINTGIRYASIIHDYETDKRFPHAELSTGFVFNYAVVQRFSISGGINFGMKIKRSPYFKNNPFGILYIEPEYRNLPVTHGFIRSMDNTLDNRHVFIETPLLISVKIISGASLTLGGVYRFYLPQQEETSILFREDYLNRRSEFGGLLGFNYKIGDRYGLSLDYYYGLTNLIYKLLYSLNTLASTEEGSQAHNTSLGISIQYKLAKKSNR